jgi:hypothetical protein
MDYWSVEGLKYIYIISKKLYFYLYIFPLKFSYKVKVKHVRQTTQHTWSNYVA